MSETEKQRKEIIEELQKEVNRRLIDVLYEIKNIEYQDDYCCNEINSSLPWDLNEVTRLVDRARRDLDKINGHDDRSYPWA